MEKINLIFFNVTEELQIISELNQYYKSKQDYQIEFIEKPAEVTQHVMGSGSNGIVLFKIQGKADLQTAVEFLRTNKKIIRRGLVKPACIMQIKNKKVEKILEKYGCQDILEASTRSKTFSFKIDFWAKNIKSIITKAQKEKELKMRAQENKGNSPGATNEEKKENFIFTKALDLHSDTWLIKSKADAKKILKRYLIRVLGPSPHVGQWHELERKEGDSMPTWKYVIKDVEEQQFILDEGAWYFTGSKPEFDWKIDRWNFSSDAPHLYFYTGDGQIFSRFKYNEGVVEVAENSKFAKSKEEMILETCDIKFSFDKDKEDESKENIEKDAKADEIDSKLDGKLDEDEESRDDMLRGKSKNGEDDQDGSYKGKVGKNLDQEDDEEKNKSEFDEDDLGGHYGSKSKQKDDSEKENEVELTKKKKIQLEKEKQGIEAEGIDEDDLGGHYGGKKSQVEDEDENSPLNKKKKIQLDKEREGIETEGLDEGDVGGHYGGKGLTDEIDDEELSGMIKAVKKKAQDKKDKESKGFEEGDQGGHYGGKGSTDEIDDDPLNGLVKKKKLDKKKDSDSEGFDEGDQGGHYGGKGSTDEIDDDPLNGLVKKKKLDKKKESNSEGFNEGDQGGHYGGKGSTDEINDDPLSGLVKKKKLDKKKESDSEGFDEGDQGGHYGGKGSTDEIDNSPLGAKLKKQDKEDKKNRKSIFDEDDLGGHYDNEGDTDELDRSPLKGRVGKKEAEEEVDQDLLDSLMNKKKKSIDREVQNRDEKKKEDIAASNDPVGSLDDDFSDQDARDGVTEFEKNNPDVAAKKTDDEDVDELARDLFDKLRKKKEALKQAGLSDEDFNVDELSRDELVKLKEKRKADLKAAGLYEEEDDLDELGSDRPIDPERIKEDAKKKLQKDDFDVDELSRDMFDKLKKKKEALKKAGLSDEQIEAELEKEKAAIQAKASKEDYDVDELSRDMFDKLKKKKEVLKKAGLSDEDQDTESLSPKEKEALTAKRKATLEKAGLLDEEDNVDEVEDLLEKVIAKKEKKQIAKNDKLDVEEIDIDSDVADLIQKKKKSVAIAESDADSSEPAAKELDIDELEVDSDVDDLIQKKKKSVAAAGDMLGESSDDTTSEEVVESSDPNTPALKKKKPKIIGANLEVKEESIDEEELLKKQVGSASVEAKSGKDLYGAEVGKSEEGVDVLPKALVGKEVERERDDLENDMLESLMGKPKAKISLDPEDILKDEFNLKEIFSRDPGVNTESGELKVTLEEKGSNVTYICDFEDLFESEIVVITSDESIAVEGKEFNVKITLKYNGSNVVIGENAKVIEIEDFKDGIKLVSLEFENIIDEKMFETFNILYQERQESISDFMNLARGYYEEDEG